MRVTGRIAGAICTFCLLFVPFKAFSADTVSFGKITITFDGSTYDDIDDETSFRYTASTTDETPLAITGFVLGISYCNPALKLVLVNPGNATTGDEPVTGIENAINWLIDGSLNEIEFTVVLEGEVPEGNTKVGVWRKSNSGVADITGPGCQPSSEFCEEPTVIDYSELQAGEVVTNQYDALGLNISTINNNASHPDKAIVFDSSCPGGICSGGDQDLGTPNESFGGPGVGSGPGAGTGNDTALGNLLIIAEDDVDILPPFGMIDDPDDEATGGEISFVFDYPVKIGSIAWVDIETGPVATFVHLFDKYGVALSQTGVSGPGDNSAILTDVSQSEFETHEMVIDSNTSFATNGFLFCPSGPLCEEGLDECGVCDGSGPGECGCDLSEQPDECGLCTGEPGYGEGKDECGLCYGEPGYGAGKDECGFCTGEPGYGQGKDECGLCFGEPGFGEGKDECGFCTGEPGYGQGKDDCGLCFGEPGFGQGKDDCGLCYGEPGFGEGKDECGFCTGEPGYGQGKDDCGLCFGEPGFGQGKDDCGLCYGEPGFGEGKDECGFCTGEPGFGQGKDECGLCFGEPGYGEGKDECNLCPGEEGYGDGEDECGLCTGEPGYGQGKDDCELCPEDPDYGEGPDECGVCGGPGLNECGSCDPNFVKDECDVCGGTGTSCIECKDEDFTEVIFNLDGISNTQKNIVLKAIKKLGKITGKKYGKARKKAIDLHMDSWSLVWSLDVIQSSDCTGGAADLCVTTDNSSVLTAYDTNRIALKKLGKKFAKKLIKAGQSKSGKKLLKKANKASEEAGALAGNFPTANTVCP